MKKQTRIIISAIAALGVIATAVVAFFALWGQRAYERETRYRAVLEQLFQPREGAKLNPAQAGALLIELSSLIELRAEGNSAKKQAEREQVARQFSTLFQSTSFDFSDFDKLQLDLIALASWPEYKERLKANPEANSNIIHRYHLALSELRRREPEFVRMAWVDKDGRTHSPVSLSDGNNGQLLRDLNLGYASHAELLRDTMDTDPQESNKDAFLQAFCEYYDATQNPVLTQSVFSYDERQIIAERDRCDHRGMQRRQ